MKDMNKIIDDFVLQAKSDENQKVASKEVDVTELRKVASVMDTAASRMVNEPLSELIKTASRIPGNFSENDMMKLAFRAGIKKFLKSRLTRGGRSGRAAEKVQRAEAKASGLEGELKARGKTPANMSREELAKARGKYQGAGTSGSRLKELAKKHPVGTAAAGVAAADAANLDLIRQKKESNRGLNIRSA